MSRPKLILIVVLAIALAIVIMQNTETVETRLLFVTVEMSRAGLLTVSVLVGFVLGVLVTWRVGRKKTGATTPSAAAK